MSEELHPLLSGAELQHAKRYAELLATHFTHSVLDSLPEWLRRMDDKSNDGVSMGRLTSVLADKQSLLQI